MKASLLVLLLGYLLSLTSQAADAPRPNVILVIADDQGYGDLSCHGNPVLRTPNLDRLHGESIRLTDFHVTPMCTPTRGQLMTGRYCLANGAMNVSSGRTLLRRGIPTMPEIFAASGYRTGLFGKWHLGDNYPYRPMDRGFQEAVWFLSSHIGSAPDYWNNDYFDDVYNHNGRRQPYQGYCTDVFFGEAINWMRAQAAVDQPFFCYIAPNAPHGPLFVPQKYRDLYPGQPRNVASFFGMIANIDENLGKLDDFLRETGLRENTLLIFMTDNGGTAGVNVFNAGMRGRKIDLYDGGHRVPCFIRWPSGGLRPVGDVAELTAVQDLLPTLIDLCALKNPAQTQFDGLSLASLLRGEAQRLSDRMLVVQFSRMNNPVPKKGDAAVLWQRWRLVQDKELFDLATDPTQQKNVIEQHSEVAAKMRAHYGQWWAKIEPRMNEHGAITIGSDAENPVQLSPADWQDVFLDQGAQVRRGEKKNGAWNIEVAREGDYEVELRRWAREAEASVAGGLAPFKHADGDFTAGVALPIAKARIKVGAIDQSQPVKIEDKAMVFGVNLKPGRTQLQTWFYDRDGQELCGAYYVFVRRK
ncbi:MAG: arylsulfatase [Verrucomicrobia bacterium]|nr:arylsulfatase [Verrucomicrobiota bacterium]